MTTHNLAKVEDIKIGTEIGSLMNGKVSFPGKVVEITYHGVSAVNNKPYIGGYVQWSKTGRISFSFNEGNNNHVVLL